VAFFLVFLAGAFAWLLIPGLGNSTSVGAENLLPLMLVSALGFLVGLADDAYTTKPFLKFVGQFLCGVILIAFGVYIDLFGIPALDYLLTLFWVVGIMNSINMLDNMDGITGSVSLGIFGTAVALMAVLGQDTGPLYWLGLVMVGALLGYLVLNWNPSKLFMGDTGSQFLGAALAFYGIAFFWNQPNVTEQSAFTKQILMGVLAFLMPIVDTTFVTVARLRRGQSPFKGGRDHTTHHLHYIGLSQKVIPIVCLTVTLSGGVLVVMSYTLWNSWSHALAIAYAGYVLAVFGVFYVIYRRGGFVYALREARKARAVQQRMDAETAETALETLEPEKELVPVR
jgi:UDP-GlcNAc:undecaprenyl-phosphate GlcNAc-1-phosphate transferase